MIIQIHLCYPGITVCFDDVTGRVENVPAIGVLRYVGLLVDCHLVFPLLCAKVGCLMVLI